MNRVVGWRLKGMEKGLTPYDLAHSWKPLAVSDLIKR